MIRTKIPAVLICALFTYAAAAQVDCNTMDVNKVPGKWVWDERGGGDFPVTPVQWQVCTPIRKELLRIMPVAIDGLHATNSIAFGQNLAVVNTKSSPYNYVCYLILKKYECLKGLNRLQPESVTGCWVYFVVNGIENKYTSSLHFPFYENEGEFYVGDFYTRKDASGNRILYVSDFGRPDQKMGYYFSGSDRLPLRKVSWKEVIQSYKVYTEKELAEKLTYVKEGLAKNEKELAATQYEDTKKYLTGLIEDRKKEIRKHEDDKTALQNWYNSLLQHKRINEEARVKQVRLDKSEIERFISSTDLNGTYPVWIDDINFYDLSKPKDQPQCIYFWHRRQDDDLPKKNFIDLLSGQFNMDVLCRMTGEPVKKPGGINNITGSLTEAKTETKTNQTTVASYNYAFDREPAGRFPSGWEGMNNVTLQQHDSKNRLALSKDGYWYPAQYNREIKDNFSLSFDLGWNKDVAYNSGLFTVTFCSVNYDNASEKYKPAASTNIMTLYDGYAGGFDRVMVWFDPYWNGGGTVEVYSYDSRETVKVRKRVVLPGFYMENNNHKVRIERKGNSLVVFINGKQEAEIENAFIPTVKYNLYTFSRYKGSNSDNRNDVFYIDNINTAY